MNNKKLLKNYIYNTLYQVLVLLAPLITAPYVARILGAKGMGQYDYCQSIATYFVLFGAVGTSLYGQREIAYCQDDRDKRSKAFWEIELFRIISVLAASLLFVLLFCLGGNTYVQLFRILIFEVIAAAFDISWLFMGVQEFRITVLRNSIIKIVGIILVFTLVKAEDDVPLYTICLTLPILIGNISLWFSIRKYVDIDCSVFKARIQGIKNHLRSIIGLFIPQIAMEVYLVLDKTMIGLLGSDISQVGFYTQAQKLIVITLRIVTSLGTVMLPLMATIYSQGNKEKINENIQRSFHFTLMLSCALLFGITAVAPVFIPTFLGKGFDLVVPLIYYISPIMIIVGISNVLGNQYLLPTKQQTSYTISIIAGALVNFLLNFILIGYFNAIGASIATVAAEGTVTLVQCFFVRKQIDLKMCIRPIGKYLMFGIIMFVLVRLLRRLNISNIWMLVIQITIGIIIYGTLLILTKDEFVQIILRKLNKR